MEMTFRWFGTDDPVPLEHIRQTPGVEGIATSLYHVPPGEVWTRWHCVPGRWFRSQHQAAGSLRAMRQAWGSLRGKIDDDRFRQVSTLLATQETVARWWRDAALLYFQQFSRQPFPAGAPQSAHSLEFYQRRTGPEIPDFPHVAP